jgi:hypothetical protein
METEMDMDELKAKPNGASEIKAEQIATVDVLNALVEAVAEMQEALDEIKTTQGEILEKINNLTLDGDGYAYED